ncbi:MAG: 1-acyl-sn-glycerol-3-phosphate acyltransferase [Pirellulales bacterium]|nr:1-acyl-sn-glycerol-3-phosphate acyltransferase [Pirellulales bacterium]
MSNDECKKISEQRHSSPGRHDPALPTVHCPPSTVFHFLWYRFLQFLLQIIELLFFQVRYWGVSNIPRSGGVLVVSNHQSHFDPPLVGSGCPRRMNYLARLSLFRFQPFAWLIRSVNAIAIDREGLGLSGIKESLKRLKRGEMLLIFPEGTRTPDGEIGPFRPGFTTLAVRSRAAILPVAIEGAYHCWPKSRKFPRLGKIHVRYGRPLTPQDYTGLDERELLHLVERRVRECQAQLRRLPDFAP